VESIILQETEQNASNARLLGQLPPCNPLVAIEAVTEVDETTVAAVVVMTSTLEVEADILVEAATVAAIMRAVAGEDPIDAIETIMVAILVVVVTTITVVANVENEETDLTKQAARRDERAMLAHAKFSFHPLIFLAD
jgi:hypothetical protein